MFRYLTIIILSLFVKLSSAQCPPTNVQYFEDLNCFTSLANLTVQAIGLTPPLSYTWSPNVSTGSVGLNLNSNQYIITIKDANNCSMVGAYNLNLNSILTINFNSPLTKNVSCFGGNDGAISATVTGTQTNPPITYTWSTGSNSNMITNLSAGVYTLSITNSKGCTISKTYTVTQPAGNITSSITGSVNCFNGSITTSITTTGGNSSSYSYTIDGVPISGNTVTLIGGSHTVITKDANNCSATNVININQPSAPNFNFNITQPTCPTSSNGALSVNVTNMGAITNYTWEAPSSNNSSLSNIPQGNYTVTVKDAFNCIATKTVQVVPISNIQASFITTPETCSAADGAATVNVTGGSLPLSYSLNLLPTQASNVFSNLTSGIQQLVISDANTCSLVTTFSVGNTSSVVLSIVSFTNVKCFNNCDGKLVLNASNAVAPVSYSLTGMPIFSSNTITTICAGSYTIKAIDNIGCYATATVDYTNPAPYSFSVNGTSQICITKTANLNSNVFGGTAPYTYSWMPGGLTSASVNVTPLTTTIYSLNVFDANGCTLAPKQFTVYVNPPITVSVSAQNTGICPGTTAQITPSVSGGDGNYSYLWLPGNMTTPSIFLSNISIPSYTYLVNDACGSPTATQVINLQIFPVTVPSFSADMVTGCEPICVNFKNTTPKSSNTIWNFGDRPFDQNVTDPYYCYLNSGKFNVKLSLLDSNACKFSSTLSNFINVLPRPKPNFVTKPALLTDNLSEGDLVNTTTNGNYYQWFVDDVNYGSNANIQLQFNDTVCFVIKLISNNTDGCVDSLLRKVCIKPGFNFYMPNSFRPNGDGLNEVLIPHGTAWLSDNYVFRIYNRWGQLVFKTNTISEGWDGKRKGVDCPNDTYFYTIQVKDYYDKEYEYKGHITLLR